MLCKKHLVLILLIAFFLRFSPVFLHGMPLSYDSPYHERIAVQLSEEKGIPKIDSSLGGRPNIYPPFYSIALASFSHLSGLKIGFLAMLLLPLFSSLVSLSVFVFVKRTATEKKALLACFLAAIATPLLLAGFDSPENAVFFLLPAILLLFSMKKELLPALLYASALFWNYFIVIVSVLPVLVAIRHNRKALEKVILCFALMIALYFAVFGSNFLQNQNLSLGIEFIQFNLRNISLAFFLLTFVVALAAQFFSFKERLLPEQNFFRLFAKICTTLLVLGLVNALFRPWEQLKFIALGCVVFLPLLKEKKAKQFTLFLAVLFLVFSLLFSFQAGFPRIARNDLHAISFLEQLPKEGMLLAAPAMSEWIAVESNQDERLLTSLYFENEGETGQLSESLSFLLSHGENPSFLKESNTRYALFNFEDEMVRGTALLEEKKYFNKIYSLNYEYNCLFSFIPKSVSYMCGQNETKILEFNEFEAKTQP